MVLAGTHNGLMLYACITLSWCVFYRDYCIAGQLKSNISLGITKTVQVARAIEEILLYYSSIIAGLPDDCQIFCQILPDCQIIAGLKSIEDLVLLINKRKYIKHVADVYTTTCSLHTYTTPSKKKHGGLYNWNMSKLLWNEVSGKFR